MATDAFGNFQPFATPAPNADPKISSYPDLLGKPFVAGHGDPTHTPFRATQTYADVDSGIFWEWWDGEWH